MCISSNSYFLNRYVQMLPLICGTGSTSSNISKLTNCPPTTGNKWIYISRYCQQHIYSELFLFLFSILHSFSNQLSCLDLWHVLIKKKYLNTYIHTNIWVWYKKISSLSEVRKSQAWNITTTLITVGNKFL